MKKITVITIALFASGLIGCTTGQQAIEVGNPPTAESTMPEASAHLMGISFSIPAAHSIEHQDGESLVILGPALLLTVDAFESGTEISDFLNEISGNADETIFELDATTSCNQYNDGYLILGECRGVDFVVQYRIEYDESLGLDELPGVEIGVTSDKKEKYYGEITKAKPHHTFTETYEGANDPDSITTTVSDTPPSGAN
jgi:hypothetical protein